MSSSEDSDAGPKRKRKVRRLEDSPASTSSGSPIIGNSSLRRRRRHPEATISDHDSDSSPILNHRKKIRKVSEDSEDSSDDSDIGPSRLSKPRRLVSDSETDGSSSSQWESDFSDHETEPHVNNGVQAATRNDSESELSDGQSEKCPICLVSFKVQEIGTPESCDHTFCVECIQEWSKNMNTCPVDRQEYSLILVRDHINGKVTRQIPIERPLPMNEYDIFEDPTFCEICHSNEEEDRMLLCDGCDLGFHLFCLAPPLTEVPSGAWYCNDCSRNSDDSFDVYELRFMFEEDGDVTERQLRPQRRNRSARLIPRTRQTERVRRRVENNRQQNSVNNQTHQANLTTENSRVTSSTSRTRRRSKKKKSRSRKTRYKTVYKIDAVTGETVAVKERVKRNRKRRSERSTAKPKTVKKRLAQQLGICAPRTATQTLLPDVKIPNRASTASGNISGHRHDAGIPTLHLFGQNNDLDYFTDEDDYSVGSQLLIRRAPNRSDISAMHRTIRRKAVGVPNVVSSSSDLLDSILNSQEQLYARHASYSIDSSGKFKIEAKSKPKNYIDVTKEQAKGKETPYYNPNRNYNNRYNNQNQNYRPYQNRYQRPSNNYYNSNNQNYYNNEPSSSMNYGNFNDGEDNNFPQDYSRRTLCATAESNPEEDREEDQDEPNPNDESELDIYSDIETVTTTKAEETEYRPLSPPPMPSLPLMGGFDDDNDSEPDMVIDDEKLQEQENQHEYNREETAVSSTVGFSRDFGLPAGSTFPVRSNEIQSRAVQSSSLDNIKAYQYYNDDDEDSSDGCPNTNIYSREAAKPTNYEDAESDDGCPNFSIYSKESKTMALHTDVTLSSENAGSRDYQVGEVSSSPNFGTHGQGSYEPYQEDNVNPANDRDQMYDPEETFNEPPDPYDNSAPIDDDLNENPENTFNDTERPLDTTAETFSSTEQIFNTTGDTFNDSQVSKEESEHNYDPEKVYSPERDATTPNLEHTYDPENCIRTDETLNTDAEKTFDADQSYDPENIYEENSNSNDKNVDIEREIFNFNASKSSAEDRYDPALPFSDDLDDVGNESNQEEENKDKQATADKDDEQATADKDDEQAITADNDDEQAITADKYDEPITADKDEQEKTADKDEDEQAITADDTFAAPADIPTQETVEGDAKKPSKRKKIARPKKKKNNLNMLYSDSEDDENVVKKDGNSFIVSDIKAMTEDISEEERSYTPCLDEKSQKQGLEGLETEMISDEEDRNDFDESHELKTASDGDALEINAKESELDFTRPEDYEEGEIVDKNKDKDSPNEEPEVESEPEPTTVEVPVVEVKKSRKKERERPSTSDKGGNKENESTNKDSSFKRLSKSNKDRNYRGDKEKRPSSPGRHRSDERSYSRKEKKKEKRKELERYSVRAIIAEKPRPLIAKDQFGRDIRTPSRSRSRSYTPPPRSSSRPVRSPSKTRRSLSRSRASVPRRRSLSKDKSGKRRKSRNYRSASRSRSPNKKGSPQKTKKRKRSSSRYRKRKADDKSKNKRRVRSRSRRRSRSPTPVRRPRERERLDWTPMSQPQVSPSWTPPRMMDNSQLLRNEHLTVTVNNSKKKKDKRKKQDKRNKDTLENRAKKRRHERERTPPPSKEVFASGDNILVSVSFNNENETRDITTRDKRRNDEINKRRKKRKNKKDVSGIKPVAIIDLERSPFREMTPSPKQIIVLTDSDNEDGQMLRNTQSSICDSSQQVASPERGIGPKTPPEPQVKFSLAPKPPQIRAINNPLHDPEDIETSVQDAMSSRISPAGHKGPNTPPEPPNSPPSSPDAYDPFEPTKSRSPTPDLEMHSIIIKDGKESIDSRAAIDMLEKSTNPMPDAAKSLTPPLADIQPADSQSSIIQVVTPDSNLDKSPDRPQIQTVQQTSKPIAQTTPFSSVPTPINSSTPISTNLPPSRINILNSTVISPPVASPIPQRIVLPQVKSSSVKITPAKTAIKGTPVKPMLSKMNKVTRKRPQTMDDILLDFDSPYSPGSSDYEDLFEPPSEIVTKPMIKSKTKSTQKHISTFDALFGSPAYHAKQKKNKFTIKKNSYPSKTKTVGVKLDEDNLKILDELPNSAVEMQVKDKFLKKLNRQERVVEEVKLVLKPHYNKKRINKEEYKDILRRSVPKICHNKSGEINPTKIKNLIEAYVRKMKHSKKVTSSSSINPLMKI